MTQHLTFKNTLLAFSFFCHFFCTSSWKPCSFPKLRSEFPKLQDFDCTDPKDVTSVTQEQRHVLPDDHPIHAKDEYNRDSFFIALTNWDNSVKNVQALVAQGASVNINRPLISTAHYYFPHSQPAAFTTIVQTLLNAHADPTMKDEYGNGCLSVLIRPLSVKAEKVKLLIDGKANPNEMCFYKDQDKDKYASVLHLALRLKFYMHKNRHVPKMEREQEKVVHMLLDAKADPTLKDSDDIAAFGTMSLGFSHSMPPSVCEKMIRIPHIDSGTAQQALGALISHAGPEALLLACLHWKPSKKILQNVLEENKWYLNFWEGRSLNNEGEEQASRDHRAKKTILENPYSEDLQWVRDLALPSVPLDIYFPTKKLSKTKAEQLARQTVAAGFTPSKTEPAQNIVHNLRAREIGRRNLRFLKSRAVIKTQTQKDFFESKE